MTKTQELPRFSETENPMANTKRPRIFFDSPEVIRRAINIWVATTGRRREEWLEEMVRENLPDEYAQAQEAIAAESKRKKNGH